MICLLSYIACVLMPVLSIDPAYIASMHTAAIEIQEPDFVESDFETENRDTEKPDRLSGAARIIADCESGSRLANGRAAPGSWDKTAQNPVSSASGAFQFIDGTWRWVMDELGVTGYSRALHAPLDVQLQAFEWLWDEGRGKQHWQPSRSCWGGLI